MDIKKDELIKKHSIIREELINILNKEVTVYIDRPIGSLHPKHSDIIYKCNYGYIKEIIACDKKYQDAYVLGINTPIKEFKGVIKAVIFREDDIEDKLVVLPKDKLLNEKEIEDSISFIEKYFKHKIIIG